MTKNRPEDSDASRPNAGVLTEKDNDHQREDFLGQEPCKISGEVHGVSRTGVIKTND